MSAGAPGRTITLKAITDTDLWGNAPIIEKTQFFQNSDQAAKSLFLNRGPVRVLNNVPEPIYQACQFVMIQIKLQTVLIFQ